VTPRRALRLPRLASATSLNGVTFQVALSFAGEQRAHVQRAYVQRVAAALIGLGIQHFYDDNQQIAVESTDVVYDEAALLSVAS